jgi:hypothetical protein
LKSAICAQKIPHCSNMRLFSELPRARECGFTAPACKSAVPAASF